MENARQEGDASFIHHMELESVRTSKDVAAWQEILSRHEKLLALDGEEDLPEGFMTDRYALDRFGVRGTLTDDTATDDTPTE